MKKDQPSMFNYGAWGIFRHETWHGVLVLGYLESDMYQYLLVADGWNTFPRYLNYSGSSFINHYGGTFYAA